MKWYIHLAREEDIEYENECRYSITLNPKESGWHTDGGY